MLSRLALAFAMCAASVHAQAPPPFVQASIVNVSTVGHWHAGQSIGRYRLIVTTEGWEHLWSRVFVEWLPDPADPNTEWKAVAISELVPPVPPGTMLLQATARQGKTGPLLVTVRASPNRDLSEFGVKGGTFVFEATTPGVVHLRKPASSR